MDSEVEKSKSKVEAIESNDVAKKEKSKKSEESNVDRDDGDANKKPPKKKSKKDDPYANDKESRKKKKKSASFRTDSTIEALLEDHHDGNKNSTINNENDANEKSLRHDDGSPKKKKKKKTKDSQDGNGQDEDDEKVKKKKKKKDDQATSSTHNQDENDANEKSLRHDDGSPKKKKKKKTKDSQDGNGQDEDDGTVKKKKKKADLSRTVSTGSRLSSSRHSNGSSDTEGYYSTAVVEESKNGRTSTMPSAGHHEADKHKETLFDYRFMQCEMEMAQSGQLHASKQASLIPESYYNRFNSMASASNNSIIDVNMPDAGAKGSNDVVVAPIMALVTNTTRNPIFGGIEVNIALRACRPAALSHHDPMDDHSSMAPRLGAPCGPYHSPQSLANAELDLHQHHIPHLIEQVAKAQPTDDNAIQDGNPAGVPLPRFTAVAQRLGLLSTGQPRTAEDGTVRLVQAAARVSTRAGDQTDMLQLLREKQARNSGIVQDPFWDIHKELMEHKSRSLGRTSSNSPGHPNPGYSSPGHPNPGYSSPGRPVYGFGSRDFNWPRNYCSDSNIAIGISNMSTIQKGRQ